MECGCGLASRQAERPEKSQPGTTGSWKNERWVMDGSKRADELISIFSPVAVGEMSARLQVCDLGEIVDKRRFGKRQLSTYDKGV